MISPELFNILKQVVISWQVIAATVVLVIFLSLVNMAANPMSKRKSLRVKKIKDIKRPPTQPALDKDIDTSELGLDE